MQKPGPQGTGPVEVGPRKRVLLVEDESLIAMMMEQTLRELDFDVVGPYGTVHEALAAIERMPIDAGILDILNAELTYQQAVLALVQAQASRYADTAALYQALGGGWWNRDGPPPELKLDAVTAQVSPYPDVHH